MYTTHPLNGSHGDRHMCQIWLANVKSKNSYRPDTKNCKFDLEVKGQRYIRVKNVHDTSFHGDTPMGQIW